MNVESTSQLTIALCQMVSVTGDVEANLDRIAQCCAEAVGSKNTPTTKKTKQPRPDILVFPELATVGYYAGASAHRELAETANGPQVSKRLRALAKQHQVGLLVGIVERDPTNLATIYDAVLCLDAGGNVVGSYRKPHLFAETESHFSQGQAIKPLDFGPFRLGLMICADMRSPETARALVLQGAQVLIGLTHWRHDNRQEREALLPARAIENFLPVLDVNAMGESDAPGEPYGNSLAFDDRGKELLRLSNSDNDLISDIQQITLTLYPPGEHSNYGSQHFQRRKELYGVLVMDDPSEISTKGVRSIKHNEEAEDQRPALHTQYVAFLREHEDIFKTSLAEARGYFTCANSGYIGLVDDIGNLQIRHWWGLAGAFIQIRAHEGTAGYAIRFDQPYHWRGDANNPNDPYFISSDSKVRSELVAPIRVTIGETSGVAGVILLDSRNENCFNATDAKARLLAIGDQLGNTLSQAKEIPRRIVQAQTPEEVDEVLRIVRTLFDEPLAATEDSDATELMANRILSVAMGVTQATRGNIAMVEGHQLCIKARQGGAADAFVDIDLNAEKAGIKGWVIRNKQAFYAPNVHGNPKLGFRSVDFYVPTHSQVKSELAIPLIAGDHAIGVINLESDSENQFEVELEDPGIGQSIQGGRHSTLCNALAVIATHAVTISKRYQAFRNKIADAEQATNARKQYFHNTLTLFVLAAQTIAVSNAKSLNDLSQTLHQIIDEEALDTLIQPVVGQEFLDDCKAFSVDLDNTVQFNFSLQGGGYLRVCKILLQMAVRILITESCIRLHQGDITQPRIWVNLNLLGDPIVITVYRNGIIPKEIQAAFSSSTIDEGLLGERLSSVCCIAQWHNGHTRINAIQNKEGKQVGMSLVLPRS